MKKHIVIAATLFVCMNSLFAQNIEVKATVTASFEKKFTGSSNVRWEKHPKGIYLAKFQHENETCLAYFNSQGNLISSGRKLKSPELLPLQVKGSLDKLQADYETKYGVFAFGSIFEMVTGSDTEYYIPLENDRLTMMVSIKGSGVSTIHKKENRVGSVQPDQSMIAKKN